jgi:hypothetical protein
MDPVTPVGMPDSGTAGIAQQERCTAAQGQFNLEQCAAVPSGAHVQQVIIIGRRTPVSMNIVAAGAMFSDRIRTGFYATQVDELVSKFNDPAVTSGEKLAAAIDLQERISTAVMVGGISGKLAEALQTVVTKSG